MLLYKLTQQPKNRSEQNLILRVHNHPEHENVLMVSIAMTDYTPYIDVNKEEAIKMANALLTVNNEKLYSKQEIIDMINNELVVFTSHAGFKTVYKENLLMLFK